MGFKFVGPSTPVFIQRGIANVFPGLLGEDITVGTDEAPPLQRRCSFVSRRNGHAQEQYRPSGEVPLQASRSRPDTTVYDHARSRKQLQAC